MPLVFPSLVNSLFGFQLVSKRSYLGFAHPLRFRNPPAVFAAINFDPDAFAFFGFLHSHGLLTKTKSKASIVRPPRPAGIQMSGDTSASGSQADMAAAESPAPTGRRRIVVACGDGVKIEQIPRRLQI
jgi:hypothetical protein